jgi:amino-acid N-acetyltransferase
MLQGMRAASRDDLPGIAELLAPLEQKGILKPRTREQLKAELPNYTVIDLEARAAARGCPSCWFCPKIPVAVLDRPVQMV